MPRPIYIGSIEINDEYNNALIIDLYEHTGKHGNRVQIYLRTGDFEMDNLMDDEEVLLDLPVAMFIKEIDLVREKLYQILKDR